MIQPLHDVANNRRKQMNKINQLLLENVIQSRPLNSHKGDYGRVLLIGGTYPFGGAIIMAALAAVYSGAGLVTVATDKENISALHAHLPEAMSFDLKDKDLLLKQIRESDVILVGPGLAVNEFGAEIIGLLVESVTEKQYLIIDGGAVSFFSNQKRLFPKAQVIFTPHQREWERLSGLAIAQQTDHANQIAVDSFPVGTIVVQKKNGTTIYQSGETEHFPIQCGGPYQATGGMGDTLAGMIASFVGQFKQCTVLNRVRAATILHSSIADENSKEAYVVLPTSISKSIPQWMKKIAR